MENSRRRNTTTFNFSVINGRNVAARTIMLCKTADVEELPKNGWQFISYSKPHLMCIKKEKTIY